MKLDEIAQVLHARVICRGRFEGQAITHAFASDLMSDVLTVNAENLILITGLTNIQTIRTSEMSDVKHIVLVRNKKANEDMIKLAEENGISLMECEYSMFKTSGILFEAGLQPVY